MSPNAKRLLACIRMMRNPSTLAPDHWREEARHSASLIIAGY